MGKQGNKKSRTSKVSSGEKEEPSSLNAELPMKRGGRMSEAEIDYNIMETFPASDPPSWTLGIGPNRRPHEEFKG